MLISNRSNLYLSILIIASLVAMSSMGIRQSFGVMGIPYVELTSLNRGWFGFAIALQNLFWGVFSPYAGAMADRYGAFRVTLVGLLLFALGLAIMSQVGQWTWLIGQLLFGAGLAGAGMAVGIGAVSQIAPEEKRSLSIGIVTAAGSLGQFLFVPSVSEILTHFNWLYCLLILSVFTICLIPFTLSYQKIEKTQSQNDERLMLILQKALSNSSFILLTIGFFVCGFQVVFIASHLTSYLSDHNIPTNIAAWSLALVGLFNIFGTLLFGWLGGIYSKKKLLAYLYLGRSIVTLLFFIIPLSQLSALMFGIFIGFLWLGTVPLTSGLVVTFFGTRYMTMLYGVVFFSHQLGSFMGAWLGGFVYDLYGSYDPVWIGSIIFGLVATVLHWQIKEQHDSYLAK